MVRKSISKTVNEVTQGSASGFGVGEGPLNSVRVFVQVARVGGLSAAARRLGMTQGGVSHHMATLERYLGWRLFDRGAAGVSLTERGRIYFEAVSEALDTVTLTTRQMVACDPESGGRLVVRTSLPSFATHVLIPALSDFSRIGGVAVDVHTSLAPPEHRARYDVLVTRDLAVDASAHWRLAREMLVAVASPAAAAAVDGLPLADWPFLIARSRPDVLVEWTARQSIEAESVQVVAGFDHYYLAIAGVLGGLGVLVVPRLLVRDFLSCGLLVDLGLPPVRGSASYKAGVNPGSPMTGSAVAFCRWLSSLLKSEADG